MPLWTTFTEPNITNYTGMINYANDVTGDVFGMTFPFMIFIISFIAMSKYPPEKSIVASGFITTVLSVLLRMLGIVPDNIVVLVIVITGAAAAFFFRKE